MADIYETFCTLCKKPFRTRNALEKHFNKKHPGNDFPACTDFFLGDKQAPKVCPCLLRKRNQYLKWLAEVVECLNSSHNPRVPGNVVWNDDHTAARVISAMAQPLPQPDTNNETADEMLTDDDPKPNWRTTTKSHAKAQQLFMRQATKKDKKQLGAAKRSLYYLIHGNPNREGHIGQRGKKRGLVSSSRKRKIALEKEKARQKSSGEPEIDFVEEMEVDESDGPQLPPLKVMVTNDVREEEKAPLRMRMYADDEEDDEDNKEAEEREKREKRKEWKPRDVPRGQPIDLRKKLQGRRHGFGAGNMPTLSIEIREEPAS